MWIIKEALLNISEFCVIQSLRIQLRRSNWSLHIIETIIIEMIINSARFQNIDNAVSHLFSHIHSPHQAHNHFSATSRFSGFTFLLQKNNPCWSIYHDEFSKYSKFHENPLQTHKYISLTQGWQFFELQRRLGTMLAILHPLIWKQQTNKEWIITRGRSGNEAALHPQQGGT